MTNWINYDAITGKILGFYKNSIESAIPLPKISVSDDEWRDLIEYASLRKVDLTTQKIISDDSSMPVITPNWQGLTSKLRGTALFGKVYVAAKTDLNINVPFTLLTATLNSGNPNFNDLQFALFDLRGNMGSSLLESDIDQLNEVLADNNFEIIIS